MVNVKPVAVRVAGENVGVCAGAFRAEFVYDEHAVPPPASVALNCTVAFWPGFRPVTVAISGFSPVAQLVPLSAADPLLACAVMLVAVANELVTSKVNPLVLRTGLAYRRPWQAHAGPAVPVTTAADPATARRPATR